MSIVTDEMARTAVDAYDKARCAEYGLDIAVYAMSARDKQTREPMIRAAIEAALRAMWRPVEYAPEGIKLFYVGGIRDGKWAQVQFNGILLKQALDPTTPGELRASWITHFAPLLPPPERV